jgi:hypothetical protein
MPEKLYWNTVEPSLSNLLRLVMNAGQFAPFRLVGGTALSLQLGHRMSVDIDLFTDVFYGGIDFDVLDTWLRERFPYIKYNTFKPVGMGRMYYVGENVHNKLKLDVFYTDLLSGRPWRSTI